MRNQRTHKMVVIALFAAISVILQFIAIPIIPAFSFMKLDLSDVPAIAGAIFYGPIAGGTIAALRTFLHLLFTGFADPINWLGNSANLLANLTLLFPFYYLYRQRRQKPLIVVILSTVSLSIIMSIANYFVITPLYLVLFNMASDTFLGMSMAKYVLIGVLPFNIIKGLVVGTVTFALIFKLSPRLVRGK